MTNSYFDVPNWTRLARATIARAEGVNAIVDAIVTGFSYLPTPTELKKHTATFVASDTGTPGHYVIAQTYNPTTYTDGMEIVFRVANTNPGAADVNVNALGVIGLRNYAGVLLTGGECAAGAIIAARLDATFNYFRIVSPAVAVGSVTVNNLMLVSATDSTPAYALTKVIATAGGGIVITKINGGSNEALTAAMDVNGMAAAADVDDTADYVPMYDASAAAMKKTLIQNIADEGQYALIAGVYGL